MFTGKKLSIAVKKIRSHYILYLILFILTGFHAPVSGKEVTEPDLWGVAIGIRMATVPYANEKDEVYDIIPLLYYEKKRVFIHGLEVGFKFYDTDKCRISALGRYRFFDIPPEYQNEIRGNAFDLGGQVRYYITNYLNTDFEILSDDKSRIYANAVLNIPYDTGRFDLWSSLRLRWKSSSFNNAYYGLNIDDPGSAFDFYAGLDARLHVYRNFYLIGKGGLTILDDKTYSVEVIDKRLQSEVFLGIGLFKDKTEEKKKTLSSKRYVRLSHGWETPSSLGDNLTFNIDKAPYNSQMTSIFYGQPVSDHLFGLPIPVYFTPGYVLHHESKVQDRINEFVLAMKGYYTLKWPITWRLGAAEGLSYVDQIPYVEQYNMDRQDYRPSKLLNYLDFSLDIELGDLFRSEKLKDLWLGYSIHHRSGIFQTSSAFGRIRGGSNINCFYLQYHW